MSSLRSPLQTRVHPPGLPASVIERARLTVSPTWDHRVVLISASAGAGKTMLLTQRRDTLTDAGRVVAWLHLTLDEQFPETLGAAVITAVAQAYADFGHLDVAAQVGAIVADAAHAWVGDLARRLVDAPAPLTLILDDAHELRAGAEGDALIRLVRETPNTDLIVAGRRDPAIGWTRLLVDGTAAEFRVADLAFTRSEAADLLLRNTIDLEPHQLDLLLKHTEGWAAGLQLAVMAIRWLPDALAVDDYLASASGDSRPIADYLVSEILDAVPPDTLDLMRITAIPHTSTSTSPVVSPDATTPAGYSTIWSPRTC